MSKLALCVTALLVECEQAPTFSSTDVDQVLTLAAAAAAKKEPGVCIQSVFGRDWMAAVAEPEPDGWISPPERKDVRYRHLHGPERESLPATTNVDQPKVNRAKACQHALVFHKPYFLQIRTSTELYIDAYVPLEVHCPACGRGYIVSFRKNGQAWVMEPEGVHLVWES